MNTLFLTVIFFFLTQQENVFIRRKNITQFKISLITGPPVEKVNILDSGPIFSMRINYYSLTVHRTGF